jgi:hypothetical protein
MGKKECSDEKEANEEILNKSPFDEAMYTYDGFCTEMNLLVIRRGESLEEAIGRFFDEQINWYFWPYDTATLSVRDKFLQEVRSLFIKNCLYRKFNRY